MKKYKYIFLDLDGPVLDGKLRHYNCYSDIIIQMGGKPIEVEEYWNLKRNKKNKEIICEKSGIEINYSLFIDEWKKRIEEKTYLQYDVLKPDCVMAIKNMKQYSTQIILATLRNNTDNLLWQLDRLNIKEIFDIIEVCKDNKINPKYIALKKYDSYNSLMIGDTEVDIEAANMLNIKFIGIENGLRNKNIFNKLCSYNEIKDIEW